ncbi:MFS transporter [Agromyces aurantiacus]|uniref:MFS transporter n=1 Tax=Agromyces aurantiacus TaxID=165814 RepID=A0ABV9R493_9MICO|nr:MFS transporter [Agromyces aurantiacus]MBM7505482.1 MFS family permease [Agromyces aurantiacus]
MPSTEAPVVKDTRWRAYWVCVAVAAITIMDLTKVNVALPSIEEALGAGSTELQLLVSGFVLTFGLTLVPAGRLGDQGSRKVMFIVGLSLFTATSLLCAVAPTSGVLLVGRLLQGVAAGIQMPQVLGLVQQLFQGAERGAAFGLFGATIGIATAFGPTLGGLAIAIGGPEDGWRGIFWMNVPLALLAIVFAAWLLPGRPAGERARISLDPVGVVLFGIAVVCLMWPFLFTTGSPDDDPARWWTLVAFAAAAGAFVLWERRYAASGRAPLVPLDLFSRRSYRNGTMLATAYFAAMPSTFLLTNLFLQQGLGLAPVFAGMVTIGFALASAVTSWLGGRLVGRMGRVLVVGGLILLLLGFGLLVLVAIATPPGLTPWLMAGVMLIAGAGGGFVIAPNQVLALAEVPVDEGGLAGSVGQLGQRIGTAIGTAIALSLFYSTIFRVQGEEARIDVFHTAYAVGMAAVGALLLVALFIGLVDLRQRVQAASTRSAASSAESSAAESSRPKAG